ncbi:MAG: class I SAM-dependent methyltransferase [Chthoniobacteraceae bacterium]
MSLEPKDPPADYRRRLYADYSANFGAAKLLNPELQFPQFEICYQTDFPAAGGAVGDLGCGKGEWLAWMRSKGCTKLWGVDRSPSDAAIARKQNPGIEIVESGICEALREEPATFDLLHAKDVIEHLKPDELFEFLDACRWALKPGGHLWLLTYNAQSPLANATRYGDLTHEIGLTPTSMRQLLSAAGFEVVAVRGIHTCPRTIGGFIRKWMWRAFGLIAGVMLRARHGGNADGSVDTFSPDPDLFAIARKPLSAPVA